MRMLLLIPLILPILLATSAGTALGEAPPEPPELVRHGGRAGSQWIEISADDSLVLTLSQGARVARLWDFSSGRLRRVVPARLARFCGTEPRLVTLVEQDQGLEVALSDPWTGKVHWRRPVPRPLTLLFDNLMGVSRDCGVVAVGGEDGVLWVFGSAADGSPTEPQQLQVNAQGKVTKVAVSDDGSTVTGAVRKGSLVVWSWPAAERLYEGAGSVDRLLLSARGTYLVQIGTDHSVEIRDLGAGKSVVLSRRTGDRVRDATLTNDERYLGLATAAGAVRIWSTVDGASVSSFQAPIGRVESVRINPASNRILAVAPESRRSYYLDLQSGLPEHELPAQAQVYRGAINQDGRILMVSGFVRDTWDAATGKRRRHSRSQIPWASGLDFSLPTGQLVVSENSATRLWDLGGRRPPFKIEGGGALLTTAGDRVVVGQGCCQGRGRLWDIAQRRLVRELVHESSKIHTWALARQAEVLVSGGDDGTVRAWNTRSGEPLWMAQGPVSRVEELAVSPDGTRVLSRHQTGNLWLWDATGQRVRALETDAPGSVATMVFASPDLLLTTGYGADQSVQAWDLSRPKPPRRLGKLGPVAQQFHLSPDGSSMFAVSSAGRNGHHPAWLWDLGRARLESQIEVGWQGGQVAVDWRRRRLAQVLGYEIRLLALEDGQPAGPVLSHPSEVGSLVFDGTGGLLASGDTEGTVRLWDTETGTELIRLINLAEDGWAVATPDGRWDASTEAIRLGLSVWRGRRQDYQVGQGEHFTPGLHKLVLGSRFPAAR